MVCLISLKHAGRCDFVFFVELLAEGARDDSMKPVKTGPACADSRLPPETHSTNPPDEDSLAALAHRELQRLALDESCPSPPVVHGFKNITKEELSRRLQQHREGQADPFSFLGPAGGRGRRPHEVTISMLSI